MRDETTEPTPEEVELSRAHWREKYWKTLLDSLAQDAALNDHALFSQVYYYAVRVLEKAGPPTAKDAPG